MTDRYVELHARSAFSFLEGASLPEAMTQQAANLELPGLAILDRDGLYGSPRLYTTAKKLGLRSHIGAEVSVDAFGQQVRPPSWQPHTIPDRPVRLSLLCDSQTGYRNLSMLISGYKLAQRSKRDGVASFRKVEQYAEGLVCMTGGDEGPLAAADESLSLRLGLRYVRGLRSPVAAEIERIRAIRPFGSIEELARRVPSLSSADLSTLAETGALNSLGEKVHRRDALWQVERAGRQAGPLLSELDGDEEETSPLQPMNPEERMVADYAGTGVTVGRHPMAHCRTRLHSIDVFRAGDLKLVRHGVKARIAGQVIARQRPGTAHGFIFLSIEDETGIADAIIDPNLYEANRSLVTYAKFLLIEGTLQNVDKVIHIRARHIQELDITAAPMVSHDFH